MFVFIAPFNFVLAREMKTAFFALWLVGMFYCAVGYDPLDPIGNITIKWDVMSWTEDGYVAVVSINNLQMYRQIGSPGWKVGWTWAGKEVIWAMEGAQTTEEGDCSKFKQSTPHCCMKTPTVIDLLPGAPFTQQFKNCCKGGVLEAWGQDPTLAIAKFQLSVGLAGDVTEGSLPANFTLLGPGPGYTCGPAKIVTPTHYNSPDGRRKTQALMTWNVTCTYSQLLARKYSSCCVSYSTFYNEAVTSCPSCACGCDNKTDCIKGEPKLLKTPDIHTPKKDNSPLLQCTLHMCPIRIHWHVKVNYEGYWRVKVSITNFNYRMNYSMWTLVVQHPNMKNVTQVFSFKYKPVNVYESINDTGMFYGMKYYNEMLMEAGEMGIVQSEILMGKDSDTFTFGQGWAFPRKVYFNGDQCVLPSPELYPYMPNLASRSATSGLRTVCFLTVVFFMAMSMRV